MSEIVNIMIAGVISGALISIALGLQDIATEIRNMKGDRNVR